MLVASLDFVIASKATRATSAKFPLRRESHATALDGKPPRAREIEVKSQYDARIAACRGKDGAALVSCYSVHPINDEPAECMEYRRDPSGNAQWSSPVSAAQREEYAYRQSMGVYGVSPDAATIEARSLKCIVDEQAREEEAKKEAAVLRAQLDELKAEQKKKRIEADRERKAETYKEIIDGCAERLSVNSCEERAQALDDEQRQTCADDCKNAFEEKQTEIEPRSRLPARVAQAVRALIAKDRERGPPVHREHLH